MSNETDIKIENSCVDIIMPNYNKDQFIKEAINSILTQNFKNWKLTVIDGASNDNSKKILEEFEKKFNNIKVIYLKKRKNTAFSRNLGMRLSKSEYIAFLDSDDIWPKNKLSEQIAFMKKFNFDFTYTDYVPFIVKDNNKIYKKRITTPDSYTYDQFIKDTSIATSSMIIKKTTIGNIKCPNVEVLEDYPFKCKILRTGAYANKVNQNLLFYRISKNSLQSKKLRSVYWLWYINRKYNGLSILKNIISILMISFNSVKKYGIK